MGRDIFSMLFVALSAFVLYASAVHAQVLVRDIPAPSSSSSSLTYDGTAFWSGDNSNRLVKFSLEDGTPLDTILAPVNGSDGLSHDGTYLWTISGNINRQQIFKIDATSGALLDSIPDPASGYAGGMAAEGSSFWASQYFPTNQLFKISSADGSREDTIAAFGDQVRGVAYSDGFLWTTSVNADGDVVYRIDAETGELTWQFTLPEHTSLPDRRIRGIAWVDDFLWVIAIDQSSNANRVLQYDVSNAISPDILLDSDSHDYGENVVGTPAEWQVTASNIGNVTLTLDSVWFFSGTAFDITFPAAFPVNVSPESQQLISISFNPETAGTYVDTLWIASNDPDEPISSIVLRGLAHANDGEINLNPASISFGTVWFPSPVLSSSRPLEIQNLGHGGLTLQTMEITGGVSFSFEPLPLPFVIDPLSSVTLRVWYNPHEVGLHNGQLTIRSSDADEPELNIQLTGEGVVADFDAGQSIWLYHDTYDGFDNGINGVTSISDVNGDEIPDVLTSSGSGVTACLNGSSSGTADTIWTYNSRLDPNHAGMVYYDRALASMDDITGDGIEDVLIGTAGGSKSVYALSGQTGEELWMFDTRWWGDGGWVNDVEGFVDINNDLVNDVLVAGGIDGGAGGPRRVFALDGQTGDLLWEGPAYTSFYALTTVADVTGDAVPDVMGGTTSWVIGIDGATGEQLYQTSIGANSPVFDLEWLGNANPQTNTSEDVAVASAYIGIYVIDGLTGQQLWLNDIGQTFLYELTTISDISGDQVNEVVIGTTSGHVICLDGAEGFEIWDVIADPSDPENVLSLETIPDIDGDGNADIVCGTLSNLTVVLSGWDGATIFSTPGAGGFEAVDAVGYVPDIDGSNAVEILSGNRGGWVECFSGGRLEISGGSVSPLPATFELLPAYPNPFNPSTTLRFSLARAGQVNLMVYNALGQRVAELLNEHLLAGGHSVTFDAHDLPSGMYFYRLETDWFTDTQKMILLK